MHKLTYKPGKSLAHRLYPLTKLFWLFLGSILLFVISSGYLLIGIAILLFLVLLITHPPILKIRGFQLVLITGFILFSLYVLFIKSGHTLIDPGLDFLKVTSVGLEMAQLISGRFYAIVFMSYIFVLTTNPSKLAFALMKIELPYRYGFMLVTALRLAPIMEEEGRTIYQAQLVRGIRYDRAGPKKLFLLVRQFLTPLLISSLRRADRLFFSMEGRGFGRYQNRSFREQTRPTILDLYCSLGLTIIFAGVIILNSGGIV